MRSLGTMSLRLLPVVLLLPIPAWAAPGGGSEVSIYNSYGFEALPTGPLNGVDGWQTFTRGNGVAAKVVAAPEPVVGGQAIRLEVGNGQGDESLMQHMLPSFLFDRQVVTISFDIYRPAPPAGKLAQNLWWSGWWGDSPAHGLQWDIEGTRPFGWFAGAGSAPTVYDRYVNVKTVHDFRQMKAYSWYDGVLVDDGLPISGLPTLRNWGFTLTHESASGTGTSVAYIDNLRIWMVPEPGALALLAITGAAGLLRRSRA